MYKPYTQYEDSLIIKYYQDYGSNIKELREAGRTKSSIVKRAKALGIQYKKSCCTNKVYAGDIKYNTGHFVSTDKEWSDTEIKILKEKYPLYGTNIPILILQYHRSRSAIHGKAVVLGLRVKDRGHLNKWRKQYTEEEDNLIREKFPIYGSNIPELLNKYGRTKRGIAARAQVLRVRKITHLRCNLWEESDKELVKKYYPIYGYKIKQLLDKGKTRSEISAQAAWLGIKKITRTVILLSETQETTKNTYRELCEFKNILTDVVGENIDEKSN